VGGAGMRESPISQNFIFLLTLLPTGETRRDRPCALRGWGGARATSLFLGRLDRTS